ncbi:hypothetical protein ACFST9_06540 [Hymenobacter monticola]|uniref:Lipoprotein n=1 Tax=Hymenobacter monticola TaxID=1705399 RepID=A0ABY4BAU1_9BACT|nr:hypothetical protein [Hymenobacter monticola]UOE36273.1 hypothetical protein MTP16_11660 [Hymenobacter monticola]
MPSNALRFSHFIGAAILLFLGTGTSCNTKHKGVHYSSMQVIGTSNITVVVDSLPIDSRKTPNPFYMELMTEKDTFLVRPTADELSFPKLTDSLTQVVLYFKDWYGPIQGATLKGEYQFLYFPNQPATIVIDTYPFEHPTAKRWLKQRKDRIYCEIRFPQTGRFFLTSLIQDKRVIK